MVPDWRSGDCTQRRSDDEHCLRRRFNRLQRPRPQPRPTPLPALHTGDDSSNAFTRVGDKHPDSARAPVRDERLDDMQVPKMSSDGERLAVLGSWVRTAVCKQGGYDP
jgi:hypothetical protein